MNTTVTLNPPMQQGAVPASNDACLEWATTVGITAVGQPAYTFLLE